MKLSTNVTQLSEGFNWEFCRTPQGEQQQLQVQIVTQREGFNFPNLQLSPVF